MKCGRKAIMWIALVLCLVCAVLLALALHSRAEHAKPASKDPEGAIAAQEDEDRTVDVPVDFAAWQERNPDVYAWIEYPGTNVDYPIVQSAEDDAYYLRRDIDGKEAVAGSLYTEHTYNSKTFDDPVTVIYGHNMANRTMFGGLQTFLSKMDFSQQHLVYMYQKDRRVTYQIVGGVQYDLSHIIYYHDFSNDEVFNSFFDQLWKETDGTTNLDRANKPVAGDKVLILSVCKNGDDNHRYLVVCKMIEDTADPTTWPVADANKTAANKTDANKTAANA